MEQNTAEFLHKSQKVVVIFNNFFKKDEPLKISAYLNYQKDNLDKLSKPKKEVNVNEKNNGNFLISVDSAVGCVHSVCIKRKQQSLC